MRILILFCLLFSGLIGYSQDTSALKPAPEIRVAQTKASYEGGMRAIVEHFARHQTYPNAPCTGRIFVQFLIDEKGQTSDHKTIIRSNPCLDDLAIELVKSLPGKWSPATVDGKPIKSYYKVPVNYK